jgi:hypothetical protein
MTARVFLATMLLASGCATGTYEPRRSPHITQTGDMDYVRDGRHHSLGLFASGAESLVEGQPAAEQSMARFRRYNTLAGFFLLGGWAGTGLALYGLAEQDRTAVAVGLPSALLLLTVDLFLVHHFKVSFDNAIATYNDCIGLSDAACRQRVAERTQ